MISPEEFVQRCERAVVAREARAETQKRGMRELVALCSLTGYTLRQSYPNPGHIEITTCEGETVFAGPVDGFDGALHQLVEEWPA